MSDQNEAKRIGNTTDSFIVPSLAHYSQVSVGGSLVLSGEHDKPLQEEKEEEKREEKKEEEEEGWVKQKAKIEEIGRVLYKEVNERSSGGSDLVMKESDSRLSGSDTYEIMERKSTLTADNVNKEQLEEMQPPETVEKTENSITKVESAKKDETTVSKVETNNKRDERSASSSSPHTMSKLAQLTQLPSRRGDGTSSPNDNKLPGTKSFSVQSSSMSPKIRKLPKTLPKGYTRKPQTSVDSHEASELKKRLEQQRKRLDKQLSCDDAAPHRNNSGMSHSAELEGKNSLSKYGIVEDETGGSFIV